MKLISNLCRRGRSLAAAVVAFAAMAMVSVQEAAAQFTPADPVTVRDAFRPDGAGGSLETGMNLIGDGYEYLWLAGIVFVVGWLLYRRLRRATG